MQADQVPRKSERTQSREAETLIIEVGSYWCASDVIQPLELPRPPSSWDSTLPLQGMCVQFLVRELRSCVLCDVAKNKTKQNSAIKRNEAQMHATL